MSKRERRIVKSALVDLLEAPYAGDREKRSGAQLLALAMFREALHGSVSAAAEICNRVEGKVTNQAEVTLSMDAGDIHTRIEALVKKLRAEDLRENNLIQLPSPSEKTQ